MLICSLGIGHEFIGWIAGISRLVYTYDALGVMGDYFPRYMVGLGIILFVVATIQELMTIVVAAYQIVICKIKKIKNYDDYDIVEQDTYVEGNRKLRMVMKILNIVFCIIMIICLTIVSLGTLTMAMAYTLPLALLLLVFCCRWIKRGKWLYVVGSYIISAYAIYAGLMYVLSGFPKALQMFNQTGEIIVSGSVVLVFVVMTALMSICGVIDKMYTKKNKESGTRRHI